MVARLEMNALLMLKCFVHMDYRSRLRYLLLTLMIGKKLCDDFQNINGEEKRRRRPGAK
jgi:hypothetical protein